MNEGIDFEGFVPWLVLSITLIGGILRVFLLGNKGMTMDETFSVWLANHAVVDMLHWIVKIDQNQIMRVKSADFSLVKTNKNWSVEGLQANESNNANEIRVNEPTLASVDMRMPPLYWLNCPMNKFLDS